MSKNILVISTSLRSRSNSEMLADAFIKGAEAAGHNVEKISLKNKSIAFCKGCLACQKIGTCVIKDDAPAITEKMCQADVIVFATPVYYYGMSGQMKTMLDRANALFTADYKFREIYALISAAEDESYTPEKTITGIQGWIDCFENVKLAGTVFAGGVVAENDIAGHAALKEAEELGKNA